jgi:hypothetical protein
MLDLAQPHGCGSEELRQLPDQLADIPIAAVLEVALKQRDRGGVEIRAAIEDRFAAIARQGGDFLGGEACQRILEGAFTPCASRAVRMISRTVRKRGMAPRILATAAWNAIGLQAKTTQAMRLGRE